MRESGSIIEHLKKLLKARGMTYKQVAVQLGMSEAGLKRAFSKKSFTIQKLEEICRILDATIADLVRFSELETHSERMHLSYEQEELLAGDERLFCYFYLLLDGLTPEAIEAGFVFDARDSQRILRRLEDARLVDRGLGGRVRLLKSHDFIWKDDGALSKVHWPAVRSEFLDYSFKVDSAHMTFFSNRLSSSSISILRKKLDQLARQFHELAHLDKLRQDEELQSIWFMSAFRPWVFSVIGKQARRPRRTARPV